MLCVKLHRILMADAEEAMAEIWRCLEEYRMPSPAMSFKFEGHRHVTMQVKFDEPLWAEIVGQHLSRWLVAHAAMADGIELPGQFFLSEDGRRQRREQKAAFYRQPPAVRAR